MSKVPPKKTEKKKDWVLTKDALDKLLFWLDVAPERAGEQYVLIKHKLFLFFTREKCMQPEEQADETLNRVARKLTDNEVPKETTPGAYIKGVAQNVLMEDFRGTGRKESPLDELPPNLSPSEPDDLRKREELAQKEARAFCCDKCIKKLPRKERDILLMYYEGGKGQEKITFRKELAKKLGISPRALNSRVLRYRNKVRNCVEECLDATPAPKRIWEKIISAMKGLS